MLRNYQQAATDAAINWAKYKPEQPCILDIATGGGKTHIINALASHYYHAGQRVCILAHRKELLEQSGDKIASIPFGYYSASVGEKNTDAQVIVAGIQSIYNKADHFKKFDVIIVDECHRMPNSDDLGQYWRFINAHQPAKVIGLTATPYRLSSGKLGWGEVIYEAKYPLLYSMGYLAPITNKVKSTPNLSSVKLVAGEYNEGLLSHVMEDPELIAAAVKNIIAYGDARNSVLIFCVSVAHAVLLTAEMQRNNLNSAIITGETPKAEREQILEDFKAGKLKHLLNCEILLEGFDAPNIDMIVCLRPTKSKALWEQMLGRGVRKAEGKSDCFLLDMAGNLMEHGGLGTPFYEKTRKDKEKNKGRICPVCETYCEVKDRSCADCGYVFPEVEAPKANHNRYADTDSDAVFIPQPLVDYEVTGVRYKDHLSKAGNRSIKVDYICNTKYGAISEYISVYHQKEFVRQLAKQFFVTRGWDCYGDIKEYSMDDLLFHAERLKKPAKITVDHNGQFPRITRYVYGEPTAEAHRISNPASSSELLGGDSLPDW
jgi:DNA repair protein RadD